MSIEMILRIAAGLLASVCFYMTMKNHRQGNFVLSAFWFGPLIMAIRAVFA